MSATETAVYGRSKRDSTAKDFRRLDAAIAGTVIGPADPDWDAARRAWSLAVDQRPIAVALPESAEDVVAIVDFARQHGLRVAPRGTGHNAHPLEHRLVYSILVKAERMRAVEIDGQNRRARAEAGAVWMDVTVPAAEHGLAAVAGSSPDVGVVGYTLGAGMSWLSRRYGLLHRRRDRRSGIRAGLGGDPSARRRDRAAGATARRPRLDRRAVHHVRRGHDADT